jgi:hypothetical protein
MQQAQRLAALVAAAVLASHGLMTALREAGRTKGTVRVTHPFLGHYYKLLEASLTDTRADHYQIRSCGCPFVLLDCGLPGILVFVVPICLGRLYVTWSHLSGTQSIV